MQVNDSPTPDECVIDLEGSDNRICVPAHPRPCTYVRLIDADDKEIAYWSMQEWQEAPAETMGAIMGALRDANNETPKDEPTFTDAIPVCELTVQDPDTKLPVDITVYKDTGSGCMIALDNTFLEQSNELEERGDSIPSPFNEGAFITLTGID